MRPALAEVVDAALATRRSVVLEGESLDPGLAERYVGDARVRSVFVVELDEERIARTLRARSTSFGRLTARERATVAATNAMYCRWLEAECARRGLACVASQPWATLAGRAEQVLGAGPRS